MAVQLHGVTVQHADLSAQLLQNMQKQGHIADLGDVFNAAGAVHQQSGGDNAYGGVFGAADCDLSEKRMPAFNNILFHRIPFPEVKEAECLIIRAAASNAAGHSHPFIRNSISHIFSKAITNIPNPAEIFRGKYGKKKNRSPKKPFCPCFPYFYGADNLKIVEFFSKGVDTGER